MAASTSDIAEDGETAIDMNQWDPEWGLDIDVKNQLARSSNCYIHRVPKHLRAAGEDRYKYEPYVVSIGPYHRRHDMQIHASLKQLYIRSLISRVGAFAPEKLYSIMKNIVRGLLVAARESYAEAISLDDQEFLDMLVEDGCFILELLIKHQNDQETAADMIFNQNWMVAYIRRDLVLLENQIPFFVLFRLFSCLQLISFESRGFEQRTSNRQAHFRSLIKDTSSDITEFAAASLTNLIIYFFSPILRTTTYYKVAVSSDDILPKHILDCLRGKHILDCLRNHLLLHKKGTRLVLGCNATDGILWGQAICATDLQEAGVRFKKMESSDSLLKIEFHDGEFRIPPFYFGELWTVVFPNMIALEQCHSGYGDEITSYAILMDNLINSHKDVKLLRDKEIIIGSSKEDKEIADIVNNLSKQAIVNDFYYDDLCTRVKAYRQGTLATWRADFMRKFIHTPWAGISVLAAAFLLLLTVAQTLFTILSWEIAKK